MKLGMPFYLIDRTGSLTGSDYVDIYQRLTLTVRCTARDASHAAYMIYNDRTSSTPLAALDFGPKNALGTISFVPSNASSNPIAMSMKTYLDRSGGFPGNNKSTARFSGSDGQEYKWKQHVEEGQDWTCSNVNTGRYIASYGSDPSGQTSQQLFTLEEDFVHLASEILASLLIVRHIEAHRL
ncbi:hypothetical protein DL96DRAFT_1456838 [Flagelloscypha sp. PMI_526]|nr:hypothetical protein DL96DRAFT_1456838 [Flagelloscypha sp. PMI_526]